jgi:hypothetical protein
MDPEPELPDRSPPPSTEPPRWARVPPGLAWKRPGLPKDWVRVLERHPGGVVAQPGYVWLDVPGKVRHVWAAHLEVRLDETSGHRG